MYPFPPFPKVIWQNINVEALKRQLKCNCCGFISGEHIDFIKNIILPKSNTMKSFSRIIMIGCIFVYSK